jgi:O-antigen/teichoic acid export membrane protein
MVRNTAATVLARGAFGLARILFLLFVARAYAPVEFGQLALALPFLEMFRVVGDLGVDVASIRRFASAPSGANQLFDNLMGLKLVLASVALVLMLGLYAGLYGIERGFLLLLAAAPSLYTTGLTNAFVSYFQSQLKMARIVAAYVLGIVVFAALTIASTQLSLPLVAVVAAIPLGELSTLVILRNIRRAEHAINVAFDRSLILDLLRESLPVGITGVIVVVYLRLDNLLIAGMLGDVSVGEYAIAARIVEPFLLVFSSFSVSFYASLSSRWSTEPAADVWRGITRIVASIAMIGAVAAAALSLAAPPLVAQFWGEYSNSAGALAILGWTILPKAVNMQWTSILNSMGKFRIITVIAANNLALTVLGNLVLLPRYGILGAAMTVLGVEIVNTALQFVFVSSYIGTSFGKWIRQWKPINK